MQLAEDKEQQYNDQEYGSEDDTSSIKSSIVDTDSALDVVEVPDNLNQPMGTVTSQKETGTAESKNTVNKTQGDLSPGIPSSKNRLPSVDDKSHSLSGSHERSSSKAMSKQSRSKRTDTPMMENAPKRTTTIMPGKMNKMPSNMLSIGKFGGDKSNIQSIAKQSRFAPSTQSKKSQKGIDKALKEVKKDFALQIKVLSDKLESKLSPAQTDQVKMMIDAKAQIQDATNEQKFDEIAAFRKDFEDEMEGLQAGFDTQLEKMDNVERKMAKNQKEYENAQEMLQVNLRKMIKEKRIFNEKVDANNDKVDRFDGIIDTLKGTLLRYGSAINRLLISNEIDISLYAQDDIDRHNVYLYGINEKQIQGEDKSPITVNNNCVQCSGNAQFVKKAFKMACLNYSSSKVVFNKKEYGR